MLSHPASTEKDFPTTEISALHVNSTGSGVTMSLTWSSLQEKEQSTPKFNGLDSRYGM